MTAAEGSRRAAVAVAEPRVDDVTAPAFHAEVSSEEFRDAVRARRAAHSLSENLEIAKQYRVERAERAAAELRR